MKRCLCLFWLALWSVPLLAGQTSEPAELPAGTRILKNLAYGPDKAQQLDVYIPPGARQAPVILMVHGGAWRLGDKAMSSVIDNKLKHWLPRGVVFVSINYRLLPKAGPLEQERDVLRALAYVQTHSADWGANAREVVLMGHSSGAHLVDLISSDAGKAMAQIQDVSPWLGTVSLDTAAMDLRQIMEKRHLPFYDRVFGKDPGYWREASPMFRLKSSARPLLAVCSSVRADHPCAQAHAYADKARRLGVRVQVLEEPRGHAAINADLGLRGEFTNVADGFLVSLSPAFAAK